MATKNGNTANGKAVKAARNGSAKWCRPTTRLAVYLRDGMACAYCGQGVEDGAALSLDHIVPYALGGGNEVTNLVTCCMRCNSSRGARTVPQFAKAVAAYLDNGAQPRAIVAHVKACAKRELPRNEARALLARRGSVAAAVKFAR